MTVTRTCATFGFALGWTLLLGGLCCRREPDASSSDADSASVTRKPRDVVLFPDELRVADESVNAFVTSALTTSASGNYEAFRSLWSAREHPLTREEFEQGWQAVQEIRVEALERVMLDADPEAGRATREEAYALLTQTSLDPTRKPGQKSPHRRVVLMLARENDQWRLAKAPKSMRDWMKSRHSAESRSQPASSPPTNDP